MEDYIEIIHLDKSDLEEYLTINSNLKEIAGKILSLDESAVHYELERLDRDPKLDKDYPIKIGGTLWEICVDRRFENLIRMGYFNVEKKRDISFSDKDYD